MCVSAKSLSTIYSLRFKIRRAFLPRYRHDDERAPSEIANIFLPFSAEIETMFTGEKVKESLHRSESRDLNGK